MASKRKASQKRAIAPITWVTSKELIRDAKRYARVDTRTPGQQIEHWAKVGMLLHLNNGMSYSDIREKLLDKRQARKIRGASSCDDIIKLLNEVNVQDTRISSHAKRPVGK